MLKYNNNIHGTLIVALICQDGILIAGDSRITVKDPKGQDICYFDGLDKLRRLGKYPVGVSGVMTLGNILIDELIINFNEDVDTSNDGIRETFRKYLDYVIEEANVTESEIFAEYNSYVMAGYEGSTPKTYIFQDGEKSGDAVESHTGFWDRLVSKYNLPHVACDIIAKVLFREFTEFETFVNKGIGGPLHIVKIRRNNIMSNIGTNRCIRIKDNDSYLKMIFDNQKQITWIDESQKQTTYEGLLNVFVGSQEGK